MAVLTRAEKTRQIGFWTDALAKVSLGQEYTIGARRLRRADLAEIRQTLEWLDAQPTVEDEQAGRGLPRFISMLPGRRF